MGWTRRPRKRLFEMVGLSLGPGQPCRSATDHPTVTVNLPPSHPGKTPLRRSAVVLLIAAFASVAILWPARNILREVFFPENSYFTATIASELPERFQDYVPKNATAICLRTYQSAWWITVESTCSESDAKNWALSFNRTLGSTGNVPELPDHSLPAHQLGFVPIVTNHERYIWHSGNQGNISNIVYDRETQRLYYLQSRI